jgi:hypothetical protein
MDICCRKLVLFLTRIPIYVRELFGITHQGLVPFSCILTLTGLERTPRNSAARTIHRWRWIRRGLRLGCTRRQAIGPDPSISIRRSMRPGSGNIRAREQTQSDRLRIPSQPACRLQGEVWKRKEEVSRGINSGCIHLLEFADWACSVRLFAAASWPRNHCNPG